MKRKKSQSKSRRKARRARTSVLGATLWGLAVAGTQADGDPHLLPVADDTDSDFLSDAEERGLFSDPKNADEDGNLTADGVDFGLDIAARIAALETVSAGGEYPTTGTFKVGHYTFGLEQCEICGESVNMGSYEIINPVIDTAVFLPMISLHYLEHGSFSYSGSVHTGRVNILQLMSVLDPHPTPVANDTDGDLLTDAEEESLDAPPDVRDADENQIPDGIDLARNLAREIEDLETLNPGDEFPTDRIYRIARLLRGIEGCMVCGELVNMGAYELVNPVVGTSVTIPVISLHCMQHGAFDYTGSLHTGRAPVEEIDRLLHPKPTAARGWFRYE